MNASWSSNSIEHEVRRRLLAAHVLVTVHAGLAGVRLCPEPPGECLELGLATWCDRDEPGECQHARHRTRPVRRGWYTVAAMDVDLFSPATQEDWYPTYEHLRDHAPVYRVPGTDDYVISRYDDIMHVLRHQRTFPTGASKRRSEAAQAVYDAWGLGADDATRHQPAGAPPLPRPRRPVLHRCRPRRSGDRSSSR